MFDPALLDDSRLTFALSKAVITYLRSPEGVKSSSALLADIARPLLRPASNHCLQPPSKERTAH